MQRIEAVRSVSKSVARWCILASTISAITFIFLQPSNTDKINVSMLDVSPRKLRPQPIPDVQPRVPLRQQPFNVRMQDANKSPVGSYTGDDGVESLADPLAHRHCRQPL